MKTMSFSFFEPKLERSREAARHSIARISARKNDLSVPIPIDFARSVLGTAPKNPIFPADFVLQAIQSTSVPMLHTGGDHDISFPVGNSHALNGALPTLRLLTYPSAGHGPHHEHPEESPAYISWFVRSTTQN